MLARIAQHGGRAPDGPSLHHRLDQIDIGGTTSRRCGRRALRPGMQHLPPGSSSPVRRRCSAPAKLPADITLIASSTSTGVFDMIRTTGRSPPPLPRGQGTSRRQSWQHNCQLPSGYRARPRPKQGVYSRIRLAIWVSSAPRALGAQDGSPPGSARPPATARAPPPGLLPRPPLRHVLLLGRSSAYRMRTQGCGDRSPFRRLKAPKAGETHVDHVSGRPARRHRLRAACRPLPKPGRQDPRITPPGSR